MSDATIEQIPGSEPVAVAVPASDEQLVAMLVDRARSEGLQLTGEGGLLQQLTKRVLESALEGEITDHLGYEKHDAEGRGSGSSRNGTRAKTVLTDGGPVGVKVPRDVAGTFEPAIVKKRQRRLTGVDEMVLSLSAKGLTHGEISAHLAEVYGASVSKATISTITITDKVMDGMAESFDVESRKVICSTNAIESVNARIRKAVRARGHFPNEAAAMKCVYMALRSLDPTGKDFLAVLKKAVTLHAGRTSTWSWATSPRTPPGRPRTGWSRTLKSTSISLPSAPSAVHPPRHVLQRQRSGQTDPRLHQLLEHEGETAYVDRAPGEVHVKVRLVTASV